MNHPEEHDEQQLTWATSRQLPADAKLDDEHALIREDWESFSRLVKEAQVGGITLGLPRIAPAEVQPSSHWLPAIAVLAATLLFGLVTGWNIYQRWSVDTTPVAVLPDTESETLPDNRNANVDSQIQADLIVQNGNEDADSELESIGDASDPYAWEDSWDEELAVAEQAFQEIRGSWNSVESHVDSMYDAIEQYENELDEARL